MRSDKLFRSLNWGLLLTLLLAALPLRAELESYHQSLSLPSGVDVDGWYFPAEGERLLLWLPSEYGLNPERIEAHGKQLVAAGFAVWFVDLHASYFVTNGASSIDKFPRDDLRQLMQQALEVSGKTRLYLFGANRGARLALEAAQQWQLNAPQPERLKGAFLLHPVLYSSRPEVGEEAEYLPVVAASSIPLYLLQPKGSVLYWRFNQLLERLHAAGVDAYGQILPQAHDGFLMRRLERLEADDLSASESFVKQLRQGVLLLDRHPYRAAKPLPEVAPAKAVVRFNGSLRSYKGETPLPLRLSDLHGDAQDLAEYRGKVVLVSFWASWCPPCIEEWPSLQRLVRDYQDQPFKLLSVDVGESSEAVNRFVEKFGGGIPILLDANGETMRRWRVFTFPTNFLIDAEGVIRLASFGGVNWDGEEARQRIDELLGR